MDFYKPKTVLDLGTGSGNLELTFAKKVEKRGIKNVQLKNQDILDLSKITELGKFERFIIDKLTSLPHLENMQHVTKFDAKRLLRVFKKQGYKVNKFTTLNTFSFLFPTKFLSSLLQKIELKLAFPFGNLILAVFEV